MNKDTTLSIRISTDDLNTIREKAKQAHLQKDYVNRLAALLIKGKIRTVRLNGTLNALR